MIIIPMAGLSSRFSAAGYTMPKYMLPLRGKSVFAHAVESFSAYFDALPFIFIARAVADTEAFIYAQTARLGIRDARVIILDHETAGQAETVVQGIHGARLDQGAPLTIFNIDTFRPDFRFPSLPWFTRSDGYLEVFVGQGANWSYVSPMTDTSAPLVGRTAEKQPISDLCCDGLYHFAQSGDFLWALEQERKAPSMAELYVAPLYNHLIQAGRQIHYSVIAQEQVIFCGMPAEYEALLKEK